MRNLSRTRLLILSGGAVVIGVPSAFAVGTVFLTPEQPRWAPAQPQGQTRVLAAETGTAPASGLARPDGSGVVQRLAASDLQDHGGTTA